MNECNDAHSDWWLWLLFIPHMMFFLIHLQFQRLVWFKQPKSPWDKQFVQGRSRNDQFKISLELKHSNNEQVAINWRPRHKHKHKEADNAGNIKFGEIRQFIKYGKAKKDLSFLFVSHLFEIFYFLNSWFEKWISNRKTGQVTAIGQKI